MRLRNNRDGSKKCYPTYFSYKLLKDEVVFKFAAFHSKFNSFDNKYNGDLWKGDVCEVFIEFGEKGKYYEIEVAPNGCEFLSIITNVNDQISHKMVDTSFLKTKVKRFLNNYFVSIKLPLDKLNIKKKLKFNAFRIDTDGEQTDKHLIALFPTMCNSFHRYSYFQEIKLVK